MTGHDGPDELSRPSWRLAPPSNSVGARGGLHVPPRGGVPHPSVVQTCPTQHEVGTARPAEKMIAIIGWPNRLVSSIVCYPRRRVCTAFVSSRRRMRRESDMWHEEARPSLALMVTFIITIEIS